MSSNVRTTRLKLIWQLGDIQERPIIVYENVKMDIENLIIGALKCGREFIKYNNKTNTRHSIYL